MTIYDLRKLVRENKIVPGQYYTIDTGETFLALTNKNLKLYSVNKKTNKAKEEIIDLVSTLTDNVATIITEIDFGSLINSENTTTTKFIPFVQLNNNNINLEVITDRTEDHEEEDCIIENISVKVLSKINNSGFTIMAYAPEGSFGKYKVKIEIK